LIVAVYLLVLLFFLFGVFTLNSIIHAFNRSQSIGAKEQKKQLENLLFFRTLKKRWFRRHPFESTYFFLVVTQNFMRFLYMITVVFFDYALELFPFQSEGSAPYVHWAVLYYLFFLACYIFLGEMLPRSMGFRHPSKTSDYFAGSASLYLLAFLPLSLPLFKIFQDAKGNIFPITIEKPEERVKKELIEIIQESDVGESLDPVDRELIESVVKFQARIAREVMVPRVDIFSIPGKATIKEAAKMMEDEGYSRVPVFQNTVDHILGILMYKDIIKKYMEFADSPEKPEILEAPITTIIKKPLYTPETKKISHLLQDFRNTQLHMAIIVDEYGGTEGIVTIEDILEEIVGEIEDEYDTDTELFASLSQGAWAVDARITIMDLEEETGIKVPQEGEYDTVGGYIFHKTGTIPKPGFIIDHDDFKMEIIETTDRGVERIKITPKKDQS